MADRRLNKLIILTPEGCRFSLLLAGPITRFLAWCVDLVVILALTLAADRFLSIFAVVSPDLANAALFLLLFGFWFGYGIILEWFWRGRTVGKKVLRLRVMDEQGLPLKFSQVVIRNLMRFVDMMPLCYTVGGLACLLTRRGQRLGDLAAGTVVVRNPRLAEPDLARAVGESFKFNSFREFPHLEARLRHRVSPAEARVALLALLRRDQLLPEARIELFAQLADHFRPVVQFPDAAIAGLSDEHYVRNVVDTLFRSQLNA